MKRVRATIPYYRSSYVFVTRRAIISSSPRFDDPSIGNRRIGLQILEEDFSPPSLPLIRSGHAAQLVGFESFGQGGRSISPAVADGRVGLLGRLGPVAGYYAARQQRSAVTLTRAAIGRVRNSVLALRSPLQFMATILTLADAVECSDSPQSETRSKPSSMRYHVPLESTKEGAN